MSEKKLYELVNIEDKDYESVEDTSDNIDELLSYMSTEETLKNWEIREYTHTKTHKLTVKTKTRTVRDKHVALRD